MEGLRGADGLVVARAVRGGDGLLQDGEQFADARGGGVEQRGWLAVFLERQRDHAEGVGDVVENEEAVGNDKFRQRALGGQVVRHARFKEMHHFIGDVADESPAETGQAGEMREGVGLHEVAQDAERVSVVRDALFVDALTNDDIVAIDGDSGAGGDAHEGVAAPAFAAFGAFEQEKVGAVRRKTGQHGDGGLRVGEDARANGDDGGGFEQGIERFAGREGFQEHGFSLGHDFFWFSNVSTHRNTRAAICQAVCEKNFASVIWRGKQRI